MKINGLDITVSAVTSVCTGISVLLAAIAYVPWFFPDGYERLHRSGLIHVVPLIAAIQVGAASAWLCYEIRKHEGNEET